MTELNDQIFKKLEKLTEDVKKKLKTKGVIIPYKNDDGSIIIGRYQILKEGMYYQIYHLQDGLVVDNINLPQSAILIANRLAINNSFDQIILSKDRSFGYAVFEEELHKKSALNVLKKDSSRADLLMIKSLINKDKKERLKFDIDFTFRKLINFV